MGLFADARVDMALRESITKLRADLDPVRLLADIRSAQQVLVALADVADESQTRTSQQAMPLDDFMSGLRTAWEDGEVRPTSRPKPKAKRGRRRPDPLAAVTDELRSWFEADLRRPAGNCSIDCRLSTLIIIRTVLSAPCNAD